MDLEKKNYEIGAEGERYELPIKAHTSGSFIFKVCEADGRYYGCADQISIGKEKMMCKIGGIIGRV